MPDKLVFDATGVRPTAYWCVGAIAESIVEQVKQFGSHMIYMGTRGQTPLANIMLGSVATRVLHLAHIRIVLIH